MRRATWVDAIAATGLLVTVVRPALPELRRPQPDVMRVSAHARSHSCQPLDVPSGLCAIPAAFWLIDRLIPGVHDAPASAGQTPPRILVVRGATLRASPALSA